MLKEDELSARSRFTARKCGRSPRSRSSWLRISPPRPSSPSRTRGCSASCAKSAATADRDRRRAQGHQPVRPVNWSRCSDHAGERNAHLWGEIWHAVAATKGTLSHGRICMVTSRRLDQAGAATRSTAQTRTTSGAYCRGPTDRFRSLTSMPSRRICGRPATGCCRRHRRRSHHACRADAQGERTRRRNRHLPQGGACRSPTSRLSW